MSERTTHSTSQRTSSGTWLAGTARIAGRHAAAPLSRKASLHCGTLAQLPSAAALYDFSEGPDAQVALDMRPVGLDALMRYEAREPAAEKYRYVCGPIPVDAMDAMDAMDAVVEREPWW